jgi:hypothetical protein
LEANASSIRISNDKQIMATEMLCNPKDNLSAQLGSLLMHRGGYFVVNLHNGELEFDYLPNVTPLAATSTLRQKVGAFIIGVTAADSIKGLLIQAGTAGKDIATNVWKRAELSYEVPMHGGGTLKIGIGPDISQKR